MYKGVLIFGACHLTKTILSIFQQHNLIVYGILEDDPTWHHKEIHEISILGTTDNQTFLALLDKECASFLAYGNRAKRKKYLDFLTSQAKSKPISAIHPSAIITDPMFLGQGNYIGAYTCLATSVTIGDYCILHNNVSLGAQTTIHDWVEIGAGCMIGDHVIIEADVSIGIGSRIAPGVTIQKGAIIDTGAVVLRDVKS